VAIAGLVGLVGRAGERLLVLVTALSLATLAVAVVRLGRILLGRGPRRGRVSCSPRPRCCSTRRKAYVDLPFLAAAAWARLERSARAAGGR